MERIYIFITCCIAGIIGTAASMVLGLHWSCMIGTIIFVVAIALSLDNYFKEKREEEDREYSRLISRRRAIDEFVIEIGMDRRRAENLYNSGYRSIADFQDMSLEELMEMDDINPTLAKRIANKAAQL